MPGVPHEMKAMWTESVRPLLMERQNCTLHSVTLRVLGGESDIEYRVRDLLENPNPTAAIYCKTGECEIRITARARSDEDGEKMCRAYAKKFYDTLGDAVYDEDVAGLEETVVHTLKKKGLTIATAESCTGGIIAQRLTSVSGSSEVFGYGFVTYWEQAKAKLVGVDPAVIGKYNVVSAPVAAQMALGAAAASGADIALSVTGVAGPTGGDEVRPVGTVYLGAAAGWRGLCQKALRLPARPCAGACPGRTGGTGDGSASGTGQDPRRDAGPHRRPAVGRRGAGRAGQGFRPGKHHNKGLMGFGRGDPLCAAPVRCAAGTAGSCGGAVCAPVEGRGPVEVPGRRDAAGCPCRHTLWAEESGPEPAQQLRCRCVWGREYQSGGCRRAGAGSP